MGYGCTTECPGSQDRREGGKISSIGIGLAWSTIIAIAVGVLSPAMASGQTYRNVSVQEAFNLILSETRLRIVDVRTQVEYDTGHIKNSVLVPSDRVRVMTGCTPCGTATWVPNPLLPANRTMPVLIYCARGGRSAVASRTLVDLGYTQVYSMLGGFTEWVQAGCPYELPELGILGACLVLASIKPLTRARLTRFWSILVG